MRPGRTKCCVRERESAYVRFIGAQLLWSWWLTGLTSLRCLYRRDLSESNAYYQDNNRLLARSGLYFASPMISHYLTIAALPHVDALMMRLSSRFTLARSPRIIRFSIYIIHFTRGGGVGVLIYICCWGSGCSSSRFPQSWQQVLVFGILHKLGWMSSWVINLYLRERIALTLTESSIPYTFPLILLWSVELYPYRDDIQGHQDVGAKLEGAAVVFNALMSRSCTYTTRTPEKNHIEWMNIFIW